MFLIWACESKVLQGKRARFLLIIVCPFVGASRVLGTLMQESLGCIVVGAGVIGLAIARRLAIAGHEVVVLEKEMEIAVHTSSRNSEVIHAGIYYPKESLKARLCIAGRQSLYEYCNQKHVPYEEIGKYIVATSEKDMPRLMTLRRKAVENGVTDLQLLSGQEISNIEPAVSCVAGLYSPATGILDSHSYLLALQADLESAGGSVICDSPVARVRVVDGCFNVSIECGFNRSTQRIV